jgi:predicted glutamine amidotransferase
MCIAILQKENSKLDRRLIENCWTNNPHGAGLLWTENGCLKCFKSLDNLPQFIEKYEAVTKDFGRFSKIVLHFRIATHGEKDFNNCHPHFVSDKIAFVHNGIIHVPMDLKEIKSDTVVFNETILRKLPENFIENVAVQELLMRYTTGSKLVFLSSANVSYIVHENDGHWISDGIWCSNHSYTSYNDFSRLSLLDQRWYPEKRSGLDRDDRLDFSEEFEQCLSCGGFLDSPRSLEQGYCDDCYSFYLKDDNFYPMTKGGLFAK